MKSDNPALLISLGIAPAVVPEAFLLPEARFASVHVLTTETTDVSLVENFFANYAPEVALAVCRVDGFTNLKSEQDHFSFEEVLYRWVLETGLRPQNRYFCLSGGFKTMSAAMQKAAAVLGAAEVFHVLAEGKPSTIEEILEAERQQNLRWIRLGREDGWPQFRNANAREFPLRSIRSKGCVRWVRAEDNRFREQLREIVQRSHNIAGAWNRIADLPFPILATCLETRFAGLSNHLTHMTQLTADGLPPCPRSICIVTSAASLRTMRCWSISAARPRRRLACHR